MSFSHMTTRASGYISKSIKYICGGMGRLVVLYRRGLVGYINQSYLKTHIDTGIQPFGESEDHAARLSHRIE